MQFVRFLLRMRPSASVSHVLPRGTNKQVHVCRSYPLMLDHVKNLYVFACTTQK